MLQERDERVKPVEKRKGGQKDKKEKKSGGKWEKRGNRREGTENSQNRHRLRRLGIMKGGRENGEGS